MADVRNDPLEVEQGTDFETSWPVTFPADLTGWTARGDIRRSALHSTVLHTLDATIETGRLYVRVPGDESAEWDWDSAHYKVYLVAPDGRSDRVSEGPVRVNPDYPPAL